MTATDDPNTDAAPDTEPKKWDRRGLLRRIDLSVEHLREAGGLPRFYGVAYWHPHAHAAVCYPIPLNLLVRWGRRVSDYVRGVGVQDNHIRTVLERMHERGRQRGYRRGQEAVWSQLEKRLEEGFEQSETPGVRTGGSPKERTNAS